MPDKKRRDITLPLITVLADALAIEVSFLIAYWIRFYSPFTKLVPVTQGIPPLNAYIVGSLIAIPVWIWLMRQEGLYQQHRIIHFSDDFFAIVRIVVIGMLIIAGAAFFYRGFSYSRVVFVLIGITSIVMLSLERFFLFHFEQWWYRHNHDNKHVLILGSGENANRLSSFFSAHPELGYNTVATIDAQNISLESQSLPELIKSQGIDTVIFSFLENDHKRTEAIVRQCEGLDVTMMFVPDILDVMTTNVKIRHIDGIPLLTIKTPALSPWNRIIKRTFDIIFASIILILFSPLFLFLMILVKIDSRGPIFYLQERIGMDGEIFHVIKFRSMKVDAEKQSGPVWAKKDDPRTTRVGKFLRRFSLDELPQLINVLKGDMSIVGPRPERPYFVEQFKKEIPKYLDRHRVKTGMTGWAQVNGLRGNAPIAQRTQYDLFYIENWSLAFDIKIILKTIYAVLFGKDAY
ncbi:MAG TPA: undecaprenyl-phosphate glucose phosphotransferase [Bacteroidota bacterium]|nr:undecaprenyl-phosphate glucose phosphotransferase [Bacteroidota bacterium]